METDQTKIRRLRRGHAFGFVWNNYTQESINKIQSLTTRKVPPRYIIYGKEVGEQEGTPHLQGYVYFEAARTINQVSKLFHVGPKNTAHIFHAGGDTLQNCDYSSKDDDFFEFGTRPLTQREKGELEKSRWSNTRKYILTGEFDKIDDEAWCRCASRINFMVYARSKPEPLKESPEILKVNTYSEALDLYPNAWVKPFRDNNWDGYMYEEEVIMHEFDAPIQVLLDLVSIRPFRVPFKGGYFYVRPKKIILYLNIYDPNKSIKSIRNSIIQ